MKLIIYGNGGLAKLMYHYFTKDSKYTIIAFTADSRYIKDNIINNIPVIAFENIEEKYPTKDYKMFVAIGYSNMHARKDMYQEAKDKGYELVNYISSHSIPHHNDIGDNNAILDNVILEPFSQLGNNNVIWSGSIVCHHAVIRNHTFIAAQSIVGGFSIVEDYCFLGYNSTIIEKIKIANETFVGAKSLVLKNTKPSSRYLGSPARKISEFNNTADKVKG